MHTGKEREMARSSLGSVTKRDNGSWLVRVTVPSRDGKQRRKTKTVRGSKREAEKVLHELLAAAGKCRDVTFDEFCEHRYVPWHDSKYSRRESQAKWHRDIGKLRERFGALKMEQLTPDVLELWADDPKTSTHLVNKMKAAMRKAYEWEFVERDPMLAIKPARNAPSKERLSEGDLRLVLSLLEGSDIEAVVLLMGTVGLRREEAMALDWRDIDFERGLVSISRTWHFEHGEGWFEDTKNASSMRVAAIGRATLARLDEIRRTGGVVRMGAVCVSPRTGERMAPNTAAAKWRAVAKPALGERYVPMKNLRHTAGSIMADNGARSESIADQLGHATSRMTETRYVRAERRNLECAEAMEKALG